MKQELQEVPLNQIKVKENYRKTFRDDTLAELSKSIKQNGVIEPIIVRPNGKGYIIIAGERRFRASQLAGLVTIPAVIREADSLDALKLQIIENVQREGVPFMEEAYGIQQLRDKGSYDVKEIAKLLGKSDSYVYFQLRLTAMSPEARSIAEKGWLLKAVAWEIAKLTDEDNQTKAANELADLRDKYARQNHGEVSLMHALTDKITADAETTRLLVEAMDDGQIDAGERSALRRAMTTARSNMADLDRLLNQIAEGA